MTRGGFGEMASHENPIRRQLSASRHDQQLFANETAGRPIVEVVQRGLTSLPNHIANGVSSQRPHRASRPSAPALELDRVIQIASEYRRWNQRFIEAIGPVRHNRGGLLCHSFYHYSIFRLLASQTSHLIVQSCDDRTQASYQLSGPLRRPTCG